MQGKITKGWWAVQELNLRPPRQAGALRHRRKNSEIAFEASADDVTRFSLFIKARGIRDFVFARGGAMLLGENVKINYRGG